MVNTIASILMAKIVSDNKYVKWKNKIADVIAKHITKLYETFKKQIV